jgi:hypothetical protein
MTKETEKSANYDPAMKTRLTLFAIAVTMLTSLNAQMPGVKARTVYHTDGTYTESMQDPVTREQREVTYNAQKVKIAERVYLLNERGIPMQGNVYDGRGQLRSRVQVLFDQFDRQTEQRMMNLNGEVYQQILFQYDAKGTQLPPKVINHSNVSSPDMKPASIDLTGQGRLPGRLDRSQGEPTASPQQGNVPALPANGGNAGRLPPAGILPGTPTTPPAEPEKKPGFFRRIFGGKEKTNGQ